MQSNLIHSVCTRVRLQNPMHQLSSCHGQPDQEPLSKSVIRLPLLEPWMKEYASAFVFLTPRSNPVKLRRHVDRVVSTAGCQDLVWSGPVWSESLPGCEMWSAWDLCPAGWRMRGYGSSVTINNPASLYTQSPDIINLVQHNLQHLGILIMFVYTGSDL